MAGRHPGGGDALRAEVWFPVEETSYDLWLEESQSAVTWEEDFLAKQVLTLYFTDGRALEMRML